MPHLELLLHPGWTAEELTDAVIRRTGIASPHYRICSQSLDARNHHNIHFRIRVEYDSVPLPSADVFTVPPVTDPVHVVVVGLGPAGYFAALLLAMAGCRVTVIEQGKPVEARFADICRLDNEGVVDPASNYLYGEGGAGTFSDGKLTSRTKSIRAERAFIYQRYIEAGAPEEIASLSKPHVGSDRLRAMMPRLREKLRSYGAEIQFGCRLAGVHADGSIETDRGRYIPDYCVLAPGHSSYETYRMLIEQGVSFHPKECAIGVRVEHPQELINRAQWGRASVSGLAAADYALTYKSDSRRVYSFCMCPGGTVVPAARTARHPGVNGASVYARNGTYANAAIVSSFHMDRFAGRTTDPREVLDYFESLQEALALRSDGIAMPVNRICDFIQKRTTSQHCTATYPCGTYTDSFDGLLDAGTLAALRAALRSFSRKIPGFEDGIVIGTELTSSAPIQVARDRSGLVDGFHSLYICGEGSGYAGGIVSSAADGMRTARSIIARQSAK